MNTKTIALAGFLLATSAININQASAEERMFEPYVGLDFSSIKADYKTSDGINWGDVFNDSFRGVNPYIGAKIHKNFAIELGYLKTNGATKAEDASVVLGTPGAEVSTELKLKGFHFDVVGNYPINEKLDLLGSVGLARLKADAKATVTAGTLSAEATDDESDTALRFGLGANYAITENVGIRGMFRYMKVDFDDTADSLMQYSVGINYKF